MKTNAAVALLAMATLGLTENGFVKIACFVVLTINFVILTMQFEEKLC